MNVVLYMRYSSNRQTEQSIEGQRRVCEEFCVRNGYTIVREYVDRATSAYTHTEKRERFQQMMRDAEHAAWEAVIVYTLDRFARNRYDAATYKARLKKYGKRVISATETISDAPEGIILESVLEGMAEFYSAELSQKIKRGQNETALKALSCGGHIPLGYKIIDKHYVIDEAAAQIVREAFDLYAQGETTGYIQKVFNQKGYKTSTGKPFGKNSFFKMLHNERYIGTYVYDSVRVENAIPPIIDKEVYDAVQKRLGSNAAAPARGKAKVDYMLSGKIFCGHCSSPMVGESGHGKHDVVYHYYTCAGRRSHHTCDKKPIRKDVIERAVAADAMAMLTPEMIDELATMAVDENNRLIMENGVIPALMDEIAQKEKAINNLIAMVEAGAASPTLAARINALEDEKATAQARLEAENDNVVILEKEHVVWWLESFADGDIDDPKFQRHLLDMLVNSVTVWDDPDGYTITTVYNLTDKPQSNRHIDGSDMSFHVPPKEANPNTFLYFGLVFAKTTKHRA